jgi:hypothetical protein
MGCELVLGVRMLRVKYLDTSFVTRLLVSFELGHLYCLSIVIVHMWRSTIGNPDPEPRLEPLPATIPSTFMPPSNKCGRPQLQTRPLPVVPRMPSMPTRNPHFWLCRPRMPSMPTRHPPLPVIALDLIGNSLTARRGARINLEIRERFSETPTHGNDVNCVNGEEEPRRLVQRERL